MLTRDDLEPMTDGQRLALFEKLLTHCYGGRVAAFAADFNLSRTTPARWRQNPAALPWAVLYALNAMATSKAAIRQRAADTIATALNQAADDLTAAADRLRDLAR